MKRVLIYIVIVVILVVGCSKNELPQPDMPSGYTPSDSPISFMIEDNWGDESDKPTTKGHIVTCSNFESFTAFGYYFPSVDGKEAEWSDEAIPNFMYNQLVERDQYSDGTFTEWRYSPKKYWSDNPNDRIRFFACAPYDCEGVELSNNTDKGAPKFAVSPHNRPFHHQDFMTAEAHLKSNGAVSFSFKHKLAQAKIYVAHKGAKSDTVKILGITVKGMRKRGDLIYDEVKNEYVWEHQQSESSETFTTATYNFWATQDVTNELKEDLPIIRLDDKISESDMAKISNYTDPSLSNGEAYMFLVPQDPIEEIEFILFFDYYNFEKRKRVQSFQKFILNNSSLIEGETKAYLLLVNPVSVGYGTITTTAEPWDDKRIDDNDNDWIVE